MIMDVSVIMPAYNAERFIEKALDSALSQNFNGSFELLVADDVSSDSTPQIIASYQQRYPDIIKPIFRKQNLGCSDNSVALVSNATGKYLAFLDSDDIWVSSDKLQVQFDFMESHNEWGMLCSEAYQIDGKGDVMFKTRKKDDQVVSFDILIRRHIDVLNSSVFMRRDLYQEMAKECQWYIDNKCFFDSVWAWWFAYRKQLYRQGKRFVAYRFLDDSDSHSSSSEKHYQSIKRYYMMKLYFLLSHPLAVEEKMDILSNEYDYLYQNARYVGEMNVRNTKAFKQMKKIKKLKFWN